jgi:hypothetical protein
VVRWRLVFADSGYNYIRKSVDFRRLVHSWNLDLGRLLTLRQLQDFISVTFPLRLRAFRASSGHRSGLSLCSRGACVGGVVQGRSPASRGGAKCACGCGVVVRARHKLRPHPTAHRVVRRRIACMGVGLGTDWARVGLRLGSSWVQVGLELCVGWARVGCTSAMVECKGRVQGSGGASRLRGLAVVSDGVWEQSGMRDEVRCGVRNDRSRGVWGGCVNGSVGRRSGADVGRRSGARAASVKRTFKEVCGRESRKALASAPGA